MRYLYLVLFFLFQSTLYAQDLLIYSYDGPTTYTKYAEFAHSFTIQYGGIVPITQIPSHNFYLSVDDVLDANDYYIGYGEQDSYDLQPGDYTTVWMGYSSLDIAPGTYFLIYVMDPDNIIEETDEENNKLVIGGITITPPDIDFSFTNFSLDKSTYSHFEIINPAFEVVNQGTTNAGDGLRTAFYLSNDNTLSDDDLYLDYDYSTLMGPDHVVDWVHFRLVTPQVPLGDYYIIARTNFYPNATMLFEETDNTNNIASQVISIAAPPPLDLSITYASLSVISPEFGFMYGNCVVMNAGEIGLGGYQLEIQFREINGGLVTPYQNLQPTDHLRPDINNVVFSPYYLLPPGTYAYALRINSNQNITETDYSNNEYLSTETIVIGSPPLAQVTVNEISIPEGITDVDTEITLHVDLTNSGTDPDYIQYFGIEIADDEDNPVYYNEISTHINFAPGTSTTQLIPLSLEQPLETGNYKLTILDRYPYNTIFEQTQTEFTIVPAQYTFTSLIKGEDGTSIDKGKLFLYQKDPAGVVSFIQKIDPYEASSFTFDLTQRPHTLYFVPDPILYPDYVPTIYGKTVTLSDGNFFIPAADIDTVFRILKVTPPETGSAYIDGVVLTDDSGGRSGGDGIPVVGVGVLLLSAAGDVVGITYTNDEGYFEFRNLPADSYQILIATEPDYVPTPTPVTVNLSGANANVTMMFTETGIETVINEVVGIENLLSKITGYPNPTRDKVKLKVPQPCHISVTNTSGVTQGCITYQNEELDFTQVPAGVYLINITRDRDSRVLKIIKY